MNVTLSMHRTECLQPHPWWFILHWPTGGCGLLAWKDSNGPTAHMPALYLHRDQTEAKQLPGAIKHCASVQTWLMAHSSLLSVCAVKPDWLWGVYDILRDRTSEQYIKSSRWNLDLLFFGLSCKELLWNGIWFGWTAPIQGEKILSW